MGQLDA
ncbi:hypothetical protein WJX81_006029 [Elliptochloris bilobata]